MQTRGPVPSLGRKTPTREQVARVASRVWVGEDNTNREQVGSVVFSHV